MLRLIIATDTSLMLGSGSGRGSYIDSDIVVDDLGLPVFPARRLKGLLRESALEVKEMLQQAGLEEFIPLSIEKVFGSSICPAAIRLNNLCPPDYEETIQCLNYIHQEFPQIINKETVTSSLTDIRQQTAINKEGYAKEGSLRSIRVLRKPYTFAGTIEVLDLELKTEIETLLALACLNLKRVGSSRNRGWGAVTCSLYAEDGENLGDKVIADLKSWVPGQKPQRTGASPEVNISAAAHSPAGTCRYSHKLKYRIINTAPLLFTSSDGDENMVTTLDYIPGTALHGYYANELIKKRRLKPAQAQEDEVFRQWFLEGYLGFSNALLVYNEADFEKYPLYPIPLFVRTDKQKESPYNLLTDEVEDTQAVGGFGCIIGNELLLRKEPEKVVDFHLVRNRNVNPAKARIEGRVEDEGIFHYQALKAGQEFHGCVLGSEDNLEAFQSYIIDKSEIRLGRSISTQYGTCRIMFGEIQENAGSMDDSLLGEDENLGLEHDQLLLYFVSPVVLYNDYGYTVAAAQNLTSTLEQRLDLNNGSIEVLNSFAREMESSSFVTHWKMPEPVVRGWVPGSSFLLQFKVDINESLEKKIIALMQEGLGEKRHLGFGQVKFVRSLPSVKEYYFSGLKKEFDKPGEITPLAERIIEQIYQDYYERVVLSAANQRASNYYANNSNVRLSSNLLGRLERIVQDSQDPKDLAGKINELRAKARGPLIDMKLNDAELFEELTDIKLEQWRQVAAQAEWDLLRRFKHEFGLEEKNVDLYKKYWQVFFRTLRQLYKAENISKERRDSNAVSK